MISVLWFSNFVLFLSNSQKTFIIIYSVLRALEIWLKELRFVGSQSSNLKLKRYSIKSRLGSEPGKHHITDL